jgi:23S rRNA (pseudouridine1915-N3)-methyltransferase
MKKIEIISIGKLKFEGLKEMETNYLQKLKRFIDLKITHLRDPKLKNERENVKKEGELILAKLKPNDFVIACDSAGKEIDSKSFSKFLNQELSTLSSGRLVFLIGGYAGLSENLDKIINRKISFSRMTFAHDLFRIILLEQLYRAFTIIKNIKYHR